MSTVARHTRAFPLFPHLHYSPEWTESDSDSDSDSGYQYDHY